MELRVHQHAFGKWLLRVRTGDPDVARSGRSLITLLAWCCALAPVLAFPALLFPSGGLVCGALLLVTVGYVASIALARAGHVTTATVLTMSMYAALIVGIALIVDYAWAAPVFDVAFVTLAGMVLRPRWMAPVLLLSVAMSAALPLVTHGHTRRMSYPELVFYCAVAATVCAVGQGAAMRTTRRALSEAAVHRGHAESLADDLTHANAELERRVGARTAELAEALERAEALGVQLELLSRRDHLTGLHNRRALDESLATLLAPGPRQFELSLAIGDIDDFKLVNDRWGHAVGDQVLRSVADTLSACSRECDVVVRLGGEEFAIILPGLHLEEACVVCERMREQVAALRFAEAPGLSVTISLGVSQATPEANADTLLTSADTLLYLAKRAGKDRVSA